MNNPQNTDQLLNMASKQFGKTPEQLKAQLAQNDLSGFGLSPAQQQQVQNILNNPEAMNKLLSNPQIAQMLKGFGQR